MYPVEGYRPNNDEALEDDQDEIRDEDDHQNGTDEDEDQNVEGDDLMDGMERDYEDRPELDHYETVGIDDSQDANELSAMGR